MAGPLGTLIVVVLKARNLPNKQRIGKQDPYATCTYLSHRKRTKTDKRGGQHPVWDDELRFDIYDNPKDAMASASVSTTATGGVVPVKSNAPPIGTAGSAGLKELRVAVYADDPRDPDLIGEGTVDLTDTLKKGEFDDWVTVTNKGKYQGEVYLEMTFYSAKPPPDKLQTPTGPIRAGVFEASSPGSGKRPTQPVIPSSLNKKPSPSLSNTPSKTTVNPDSVPAVLRAGRPTSGPIPTGHLPFPGEPSTSKNASLNSRQRSTGSLSMPAPDFGLENHPPSRSPSRNHSLDQTDHLVNSINSWSISSRTSASNQHVYLSQPNHALEIPAFQNHSLQRPHRHSFSGNSHIQSNNTPIPQSHSISPPSHALESTEDNHSTPQYMDQSAFPPPSFPLQGASRPSVAPRRPLPIPGGDSVHRPPSAWGNSQNVAVMQVYPNNEAPVLSQPPYTSYPEDYEHNPQVMPNNGPPQLQGQHGDGHHPVNEVHRPNTGNPAQHVSYPSQQVHYYPTPPLQNAPFVQPQHVPYNLPPPPAGQAPVPIHEVFASSSGRPFPSTTPSGYPPPGNFSAQQSQAVQSPSRPTSGGGTVFNYQGTHLDHFQHHNQPYNHSIDKPISNNNTNHPYQSQNGPPPPPPPGHLQAQQPTKYHPFPAQPGSGIPPPAPSQMYYQPNYAPPPPPTSDHAYHSPSLQNYPEHNNPFHNLHRQDLGVAGIGYPRPPPSHHPHPSPSPSPSYYPPSHSYNQLAPYHQT